jgi:adenine-specific DNA-methyltransferase
LCFCFCSFGVDEIDTATIFNYRKFIDYIDDKNFLIDSYTKFSNKVGLTLSNKHIQQINEVLLSFPFKDCVLEGGQSKDDEKRKEIFFNEVLAKDEINRLLNKKVITSAKKYTQNGVSDEVNFNRNENGLIKDNLIIKGNNLLALHTLKSNFAGKVKLIYIDPPYNTGNDSFNYNDNFNHSTWLTFMKNRLEVATLKHTIFKGKRQNHFINLLNVFVR